jgi:nucleoside-diphosphate-sugar epimerase
VTKVFVTGADGFIGRNLCERLQGRGYAVTRGARRVEAQDSAEKWVSTGDLVDTKRLDALLAGHDVVVHLAGRAHRPHKHGEEEAQAFHATNVQATERLCAAAIGSGVHRFVFISSIGVLGNRSERPLTEHDAPDPIEPYAKSKLAAETALQSLAAKSSLELVIIRPTLVYGPQCPGTMARLIRLVGRGLPLPLASIEGRRSLIGIRNLTSLIESAIHHPMASGELFLAADGEDVTLSELIGHLAAGLNVAPKLFPFPRTLLSAAATLIGQRASFQKLTASLRADASKARRILGWAPEVPVSAGLRDTARSFLAAGQMP